MRTEQKIDRLKLLKTHCPELEISTETAVLESHGCDWTRFRTPDAAAVVFPRSTDEVVKLVSVGHGAPDSTGAFRRTHGSERRCGCRRR